MFSASAMLPKTLNRFDAARAKMLGHKLPDLPDKPTGAPGVPAQAVAAAAATIAL